MIIGLSGLKGTGKTAVATLLRADALKHHEIFHIVTMAKPIKDMLGAMGLTNEQINGEDKNTPLDIIGGHTGREAMQTLGTEWGRAHMTNNIWVNLWKQEAGRHQNVICDDVRFANEVQAVRDLGGINIRIENEGVENKDYHESERNVLTLDVDCVIINSGTLKQLVNKIKEKVNIL